jgi:hypothetical protein
MTEQVKPVYDNGVIRWMSQEYKLVPTVNDLEMYGVGDPTMYVKPQPNEVPRRVGGGFFYGGSIFLPKPKNKASPSSLASEMRDLLRQVKAETEARQRELLLRPVRIPPELQAEVLTRSRSGATTREIAQWLRDEMNCETSHGSVSRLLHRLSREEAQAKLATDMPELIADMKAQRETLNSTLETMGLLQDYAFEQVANGEVSPDKPMQLAFRMAREHAAILDRRLREASSFLLARERLAQLAEHRRTPAPAPRPELGLPAVAATTEALPPAPHVALASIAHSSSRLGASLGTVGLVLLFLFGALRPARAAVVDSCFERACSGSTSHLTDLAPGLADRPKGVFDVRALAEEKRQRLDQPAEPRSSSDLPATYAVEATSIPVATAWTVAAIRTASNTLSSLMPPSRTVFSWALMQASQKFTALTARQKSSKSSLVLAGFAMRVMRRRAGLDE